MIYFKQILKLPVDNCWVRIRGRPPPLQSKRRGEKVGNWEIPQYKEHSPVLHGAHLLFSRKINPGISSLGSGKSLAKGKEELICLISTCRRRSQPKTGGKRPKKKLGISPWGDQEEVSKIGCLLALLDLRDFHKLEAGIFLPFSFALRRRRPSN